MVKLKMNKKFKIPCEQIVENKQNCTKGINNLLNVFLNSVLKKSRNSQTVLSPR